jgi:TRAP-type C4-dicarboxylate transport system permease small subunit
MILLRSINAWLCRVEAAAGIVAAVALAAIMVIVALDVSMRYIFNRPFAWSYDFVSLYVMAALFFLALSRTYAVNGHINVDLLHHFLGARARRFFEFLITLCSLVLFAALTYAGATRAWSQYTGHEVMSGVYAWPAWASAVFVPIGCGLIVVRLIFDSICHLTTLISGVETLPLPPVAGSEAAVREGSFE